MLIKAEQKNRGFMLQLTEAGKAHVIKHLDIKFEPNEHVTAEEMPEHKKSVFGAWFKHCETKLNKTNNKTISLGLGYLTFEEHMIQKIQKA